MDESTKRKTVFEAESVTETKLWNTHDPTSLCHLPILSMEFTIFIQTYTLGSKYGNLTVCIPQPHIQT